MLKEMLKKTPKRIVKKAANQMFLMECLCAALNVKK